MEDDRPDTFGRDNMPGCPGGFDDANETSCRDSSISSPPKTATYPTDGKVGRSRGDLSRHVVTRASCAAVSPGGEREAEVRQRHAAVTRDDDDTGSHGGTAATGAVVDILNGTVAAQRVHVGDPASPETEERPQHEQVLSDDPVASETPVLQEVESDSDELYYNCESRSHADASCVDREHVYCTVYCIATDGYRKDFEELAEGERNNNDIEAATSPASLLSRAGGTQAMARDVVARSTPELYSLRDLADAARGSVRLSRHESREGGGGGARLSNCLVCLMDSASIAPLRCCGRAVCAECLKRYVSSQVQAGRARVACPVLECSGFLEEGLVVARLTNEELARYRYFLELCQLDASTKPCPQCSLFTTLKAAAATPDPSQHKYKIECAACGLIWCFRCHAPWHSGLRCRDYRRGDKMLRRWASVMEHGQRNAQKCPRCKIHIQRTEGCDHMTCTQCNSNFCYRCGEHYRQMRFFGDHTSNLSVFGCRYRYLPDRPHLRRLVRGSVCATKVLFAPAVLVLVLVLGALSLVIGLAVYPVYYVCKRQKKTVAQGADKAGGTFD